MYVIGPTNTAATALATWSKTKVLPGIDGGSGKLEDGRDHRRDDRGDQPEQEDPPECRPEAAADQAPASLQAVPAGDALEHDRGNGHDGAHVDSDQHRDEREQRQQQDQCAEAPRTGGTEHGGDRDHDGDGPDIGAEEDEDHGDQRPEAAPGGPIGRAKRGLAVEIAIAHRARRRRLAERDDDQER